MNQRISMWMAAGLTVVAGLVVVPCARAFERVTYTSGLEDTFAHHRVVGSVIRFYKSADETSWQDVPETRVAAITVEADPVVVASKKVSVAVAPQAANEARPTLGEMKAMLAEAGDIHDVDPALLASVVKVESGFRVDARSKAGARGLMQLMPGTAKQMGVGDPLRAQDNIRGGTAYLDELLKMYHDDLPRALAAYNAGPKAVAKYHGVPPYRETQWYVYRVIREYNRLVRARAATSVPATLATTVPATIATTMVAAR